MGASEGNIRDLIENRGAKVIYKTEEASHFIPGLNHTTGNDLDTSSKELVAQNKGAVKLSERDDARTDRELLMESNGEELERGGDEKTRVICLCRPSCRPEVGGLGGFSGQRANYLSKAGFMK